MACDFIEVNKKISVYDLNIAITMYGLVTFECVTLITVKGH